MIDWLIDTNQFFQFLLDVGQPADILPGDVGDLHHRLAERGRVGHLDSVFEVLLVDFCDANGQVESERE